MQQHSLGVSLKSYIELPWTGSGEVNKQIAYCILHDTAWNEMHFTPITNLHIEDFEKLKSVSDINPWNSVFMDTPIWYFADGYWSVVTHCFLSFIKFRGSSIRYIHSVMEGCRPIEVNILNW